MKEISDGTTILQQYKADISFVRTALSSFLKKCFIVLLSFKLHLTLDVAKWARPLQRTLKLPRTLLAQTKQPFYAYSHGPGASCDPCLCDLCQLNWLTLIRSDGSTEEWPQDGTIWCLRGSLRGQEGIQSEVWQWCLWLHIWDELNNNQKQIKCLLVLIRMAGNTLKAQI